MAKCGMTLLVIYCIYSLQSVDPINFTNVDGADVIYVHQRGILFKLTNVSVLMLHLCENIQVSLILPMSMVLVLSLCENN